MILKTEEIANEWINLFTTNGFRKLEESSLVPKKDKTILFLNAGVAVPEIKRLFKKAFNNKKVTSNNNIVNCQNVIRTNDLENIQVNSKTFYHQTLFGMLGCFSISNSTQVREKTIENIWYFITEVLGLEENRLFVTVLETEIETFNIWSKITKTKIFLGTEETNFWGTKDEGEGPCGPSSEIYYRLNDTEITFDPDNKSFLEIVNIVFPDSYYKDKKREKISAKCMDVGAGLERLALVVQKVNNTFEIDIWKEVKEYILSLNKFSENSIRVIIDHFRTIIFALADDIKIGNKGREYILKRMIKRISIISIIDKEDYSLTREDIITICEIIINSNSFYKKIGKLKENIKKKEKILEEIFHWYSRTVKTLIRNFREMKKKLKDKKNIETKNFVFLYDTLGVPTELIEKFVEENNINFNKDDYQRSLEEIRKLSKEERKNKGISNF